MPAREGEQLADDDDDDARTHVDRAYSLGPNAVDRVAAGALQLTHRYLANGPSRCMMRKEGAASVQTCNRYRMYAHLSELAMMTQQSVAKTTCKVAINADDHGAEGRTRGSPRLSFTLITRSALSRANRHGRSSPANADERTE
jgi:hypothetical protein